MENRNLCSPADSRIHNRTIHKPLFPHQRVEPLYFETFRVPLVTVSRVHCISC